MVTGKITSGSKSECRLEHHHPRGRVGATAIDIIRTAHRYVFVASPLEGGLVEPLAAPYPYDRPSIGTGDQQGKWNLWS